MNVVLGILLLALYGAFFLICLWLGGMLLGFMGLIGSFIISVISWIIKKMVEFFKGGGKK